MLQPKKVKSQPEISNTAQEGLDLLQILAKTGGKSALRKVPFGIGSTIGLIQSAATGQNPNVSDIFGLIPNGYGQAAALTMMYAEKERQNLKDYAKNKMQGKNLSNIKPDKELNLAVKSTIPETEPLAIKKKTKNTIPVTSDMGTKLLRTVLGTLLPDQAAQFLSAIVTKDNKLGADDLTPDIKEALFNSVKSAQKRTGKSSGGTQYTDFGPEAKKAFEGMSAGPGKMLSTDPAIQAASMVGRVSYKKNPKGDTEIYDSYDFSKTDPKKANSLYKQIRNYAGTALPDKGNSPNLIGIIPNEQQELAFGTNQDGIMKTRMNPRKKYLNGSNSGGVTSNGIPSPASTLNDYQIMMAKAEQEAASNEWLPVVAMVGGLAQSAIGAYGSAAGGGAGAGTLKGNSGALVAKAAASKGNKIIDTGAEGDIAANGMNDVNQDVEVEGGEMYETPQGQTGEFEGPSHEQGGIPMQVNKDIPEGTKVYSDRLKVGKETLAERKAARERKIANLEKTASTPYIDSALKNALKRKMTAVQKEEADDLAYQEQVNNMQQMADTVVAAFGTSMEGLQANPVGESMRYANGTGADGVTEYADGTDEDGIDPFKKDILGSADYDTNIIKNFHDIIGITPDMPGYGTDWGKKSNQALFDYKIKNQPGYAEEAKKAGYNTMGYTLKDMTEGGWNKPFREALGVTEEGYKYNPQQPDLSGIPKGPEDPYYNVEQGNAIVDAPSEVTDLTAQQKQADAEGAKDAAFYTPGQVGTPKVDLPGNKVTRALAKGLGSVNQMGLPGTGDITKYIGNYLDMTSGIKTAAEQRASDVTHQNVYTNAGKDSQTYLDKSMAAVEGMKSAAEMKATTASRSSKFSANNGARGQNQKRAVDFLYDQGLAENMATIHANTANQVADIYKSKATTALSADQLKGTGQYQADMANEAAKDAYFTALGKGRNQFAEGLMQTGKDINDAKENKLSWEMQKKSGTHLQGNDNGTFSNKDISFVHPKTGKKVTITQKQLKEILEQQKTKSK